MEHSKEQKSTLEEKAGKEYGKENRIIITDFCTCI